MTLAWHDQQLVGAAAGPAAMTTRLNLAATASLSALEEVIDRETAVAVTGASVTTLGSRQVALVMIVLVAGGSERTVVGAALVDGEPVQAMARATLDAMNRQLAVVAVD